MRPPPFDECLRQRLETGVFRDHKKQELKELRASLAEATDDAVRSDLRRKIAFAEAIIRIRDGSDRA